ncbi:ATP-binding protein [Massilia agilis]|uniref:histidine kinase n=1 Tax=Massilia agilis TaxID=1811226 RepID=A0ABT2DDU8_9BURK|nr:ATP-binding protein [Massilia agilis]MCS0809499.1 ATP-binding protein [Massilia agilis]
MRNWLSQSIGRKLLASFAGIFFVTYLLTAVVVFTSVRTAMMQAEAAALTRLADQKVELAANHLQAVATNLQAWSHLEVMNDLVSGDVDKRVARTLESLKSQYGLAGDIYAFDAQDRLVATSAPVRGEVALPRVWRPRGAEPALIDAHSDPLGRGKVLALSVAIKASFASGFKLGTLVVTLPWSAIETMLAASDQSIVLYKAAPPALLFSGGLALDQAALARLAQRPAQLEAGAARYVAGHSSKASALLGDWRVAALKDARVAEQPIRAVAVKLVALGVLLALPILLAVRWLSRRLTEPVQSLTSVVSQITSSGDLSARAQVSGRDELGTLAVSFNAMAGNLQRISSERERALGELGMLNKTLEQRVSDRTAALEAANRELTGALANLKATQGQLVQSEKMASLGQLVAGVAHELNNPIGFIYANFPHLEEYTNELLELIDTMRLAAVDPAQKAAIEERIRAIDLDFIKEDTVKIIRSGKSGAARIKEIVSSLRSFSRLDEAELKSVRLEDGIDDTLALLHHQIKNRITVSKDYRLNEPVVCFAGQINQVFMNIIYNALQAMDGPGTLQIATRRDGEFAQVSITDSGKGIPPDVIDKIFDPFFTTKKVGEGTGLGLSISYGIVEKHGGRIDVRSEPGKGATFTVAIRMRPLTTATIQQETASHG